MMKLVILFGSIVFFLANLFSSTVYTQGLDYLSQQYAPGSDSIPKPQNAVAVIEFGVTNLNYAYEGGRIADSVQMKLQFNPGIILIDRYTADMQMSQSSVSLNKLSYDSSYWSNIARQLGVSKIVHGIVTPTNDTTNYVDLFVTDVVRNKTRKAIFTYNPMMYADSLMSEKIQQIVFALVLTDETEQTTYVVKSRSDDDENILLWIIGGAVVVGGGVVAAILFSGGTSPSSNDLPPPPAFPNRKASP